MDQSGDDMWNWLSRWTPRILRGQECKFCGARKLYDPDRKVCVDCRTTCELCREKRPSLNFKGWCLGCTDQQARIYPKLFFTCARCQSTKLIECRGDIDAACCSQCCKQCLRCNANVYDKSLRLCWQHWKEHCVNHPEAASACPKCSGLVSPEEFGNDGMCSSCRAKKAWKICPKCKTLGLMKSRGTCWDCWDGG